MTTTIEEQTPSDGFKIDLDNPNLEPCCIDDCNRLPTFKCGIYMEFIFKGQVFICKPCYDIATKWPSQLIRHSTIVRMLMEL